MCYLRSIWVSGNKVKLRLSGLIRKASHPNTQKIRIIGFFFKNRLHWQFAYSAVAIYSMYLRLNLSTRPYLKFYKP